MQPLKYMPSSPLPELRFPRVPASKDHPPDFSGEYTMAKYAHPSAYTLVFGSEIDPGQTSLSQREYTADKEYVPNSNCENTPECSTADEEGILGDIDDAEFTESSVDSEPGDGIDITSTLF